MTDTSHMAKQHHEVDSSQVISYLPPLNPCVWM